MLKLRALKALFAWRPVKNTGVWLYEENEVTGQRRATELSGGCYQPLSYEFLRRGDWVHSRRGSYAIGSDAEIRISG